MEWSRHDRAMRVRESLKRGVPYYQSGQRGDNGRLLCALCGTELPEKRRGVYCSKECRDNAQFYFDLRYTSGRVARERTAGKCWQCGEAIRGWCFDVHHIIPLAEGGWHEPNNVAAVCSPCHRTLNAEQAARAADARRTAKEAGDPQLTLDEVAT